MINPLFICYADDAHLRAEQYAGTTAAYVLGRRNCIADEWQRVRDRGSEIYQYRIPIERPNSPLSAVDEELYLGGSANVALWPYLDGSGNQRFQVGTTAKLIDIRVGSPVVEYMVDCIAKTIRTKRYSGFFLDGFGAQLWGAAGWSGWPVLERAEWTAGAIDLARRLDEMRRAEDPNSIQLGNNSWEFGPPGEQYMDGMVAENAAITNPAVLRLVGHPYSNLGHRRVFAITSTPEKAVAWAAVPGITHVACTAENSARGDSKYSYPTKPVVGYSAIQKPSVDDQALRLQLATAQSALEVVQFDLDGAKDQCARLAASLADADSTSAAFAQRLSQIHQLSGE